MRTEPHDPAQDPPWLDRDAYPFASRRLELSRGVMHYVDEGEGDTLLFVHGTPSWSFEWRHLIRGLPASRYRCIAPDHLGFGLSERPRDGAYTPEWHAANLVEFVDRLGLDRFCLIVHDYGGPIGLPIALEAPGRIRGLVLLNTWMWSLREDRQVARAAKLVGGGLGRTLYRRANLSLRVIMPGAYADRGKLTRAIHRQYLSPFRDAWSRGAVLWPLARALMGSDAYYRSLWDRRGALYDVPALLVWGMGDPAFRPEQLARWKEALPQAGSVELPTGHWPHEEDPDAVLAAVEAFLGGLSRLA